MLDLLQTIQGNFETVKTRIERAARSSGRLPEEVRVVVVTKAQPVEVIRAAIQAGARLIGENYPEESEEKILALRNEFQVEWHMIGHLQSRKARLVAEYFDYFETLDRVDLAVKLEKLLVESGKILPVLLEMNVAGEESKYGWNAQTEETWESIVMDVEKVMQLPHLQIKGLMTMPPLFDRPEDVRPYFVKLVHLRDTLVRRIPSLELTELSMGTSSDYEVAVQEGASIIRLGTAIVGPRRVKTV
jgi:pyridoxal phosphate enzyme (YggS family)